MTSPPSTSLPTPALPNESVAQHGEGRVGTLWADEEAFRIALARSEQRRAAASARGVEFGEDEIFKILFTSM